jgi:hypothetical protein
LDITAPATDPIIFWEVGIAYAMNRIMKSTTLNLDHQFYEGKWEFATEHNIIQDPQFFHAIDSITVGNMLAETTKVINGTVECSGNNNLTHRGRYCGFMNGLNAILSDYSVPWDPTHAVEAYTKNCEGTSSITNYSQLQTYCTDNTRSGAGHDASVDLTWTNFSQSPSTPATIPVVTPSTPATIPVNLNGMVNCYIDTSQSDFENGDCTNGNPQTCHGADIVHNTFLYADPWACRVNCPNNDNQDVPFWEECHNKCVEFITGPEYDIDKYLQCLSTSDCSGDRSSQGARNLLEGSACETKFNKRLCGPGENYDTVENPGCFEWNSTKQTCFLNGNGYPLTSSSLNHCTNQQYDVTKEELDYLQKAWLDMKCNYSTPVYTRPIDQPTDENDIAYLVDIILQDGQTVQAALAFGHGVLDGKCGSCFLVEHNNRYVVLLAVDSRSWSLEISTGANLYLAQDNVGGTCYIPKVKHMDPKEIIKQVTGNYDHDVEGGASYICSVSDFSNIGHMSTETTGEGCHAIPGNNQGATDANCDPCGSGQTWWPCNVSGLCDCGTNTPTTNPTNNCDPNPCLNNSTCVDDGVTGYTCQCPPGFTGANCGTQRPCTPGVDCCIGVPGVADIGGWDFDQCMAGYLNCEEVDYCCIGDPDTGLCAIPPTINPTTSPDLQGQNIQPVNASCVGCCSRVSHIPDDWCKSIGSECDVFYPEQCMKV